MDVCSAYETYRNCLLAIVDQLGEEAISQGEISQNERDAVSEIENSFMQRSGELQEARSVVQKQYRSVWESCTQSVGLKRPRDQRPSPTNLPWKEAVRIQEQRAAEIRDWFAVKSQQAVVDRQKKAREEAAKRAAIAAAQAEEQRRREEEAARAEKRRAETLVEEMKRKYRKN